MDLNEIAGVGDCIETDVKFPQPAVIRMKLETPESCAAGNDLLMDKSSGWRLVRESGSHNGNRG